MAKKHENTLTKLYNSCEDKLFYYYRYTVSLGGLEVDEGGVG